MQQLPSDQQIIACLKSNYGIDVHTLTMLPLGADMNASVYKAQTQNQGSYFVKITHGHDHHISLAILKLLQQAQVELIIPPMLPVVTNDFTVLVYPFIEGENCFSHQLTPEQWVKLGQGLRQIHDLVVQDELASQLRREHFSPKWRQMVRGFYPLFEGEPFGDNIAQALLTFIKTHKAAIHLLVDRTENLAQQCQHYSSPLVLCHSDIHGGNVLVAGDNSLYIVDWDDPILAPKERDLMFIGAGVENVWNQPSDIAYFYQGYGETQLNMALLCYYRHERIVEDIAIYAQELLLTMEGGEKRSEMYRHFINMFESRGVVNIAFETLGYLYGEDTVLGRS